MTKLNFMAGNAYASRFSEQMDAHRRSNPTIYGEPLKRDSI